MGMKGQRPPSHIVPSAELVADVLVDSHRLEAHGLVQADAAGARQGDAGVDIVDPLQL